MDKKRGIVLLVAIILLKLENLIDRTLINTPLKFSDENKILSNLRCKT